jgi:hypothetical protein
VLQTGTSATVTWTFDDGTESHELHPSKSYGSIASRNNRLRVEPWSAVRRLNLGYDRGDGGTDAIEPNADQHVSSVENLALVAPYLIEWCSSYNDFSSLDFSHFTNLRTIECFLSSSLARVDLSDTPNLRRACFEDCRLASLDLSESPALEDLRGALNDYTTIDFGDIGQNAWHICIRENHSLTDAEMFSSMAPFPVIAELYIWNDRQSGTLSIPSTSATRNVEILAWENGYSSLDLSGSLRNEARTGVVNLRNNALTRVDISGCEQINQLDLSNNRLDAADVDYILQTLDELGRSDVNTPPGALSVDLRGNEGFTEAGETHALSLAAKGWTVRTEGRVITPEPPEDIGPVTIQFTTSGPSASMAAELSGAADVEWLWSDGVESAGVSASRTDLGNGVHAHSAVISNGAALVRFGAASGGGNGHLTGISGLDQCPNLAILYAYNESQLTGFGRTGACRVREYHLIGTAIPAAEMDSIFADAVASTVQNGTLYCANPGTSASTENRALLQARGWQLVY